MNNQTATTNFYQLREVYNFAKITKVNFKQLCENLSSFDDFEKLKKSYENGYIEPQEFIDVQYLSDNDFYYNTDYYVETYEGDICHVDEVYYCEYYEQYTSEDIYTVHIGRHEYSYSNRAIERKGLYLYNGEYYDFEALDRHNLVIMHNGDIESADDVYFWESDNEYHYEPEPRETYVRDYHNDTRTRYVNFTENPKFYIGFEIEKEDQDVKESIEIDDFEEENPNWRKEKDGSLDNESGYELISPCYELNPELIRKDIEESQTIVEHINAAKSNACGGHINVSEAGLTGIQLFEKIQGYTPLFHALYYKRIDKSYSKGKANKDLKTSTDKFQSVKIHSNRVEYRIVSAVPNLNTLIWRAKLMEFILNNQTDSPIKAFRNIQTKLKPLLSEMYPSKEKFEELIDRVVEFTEKFENLTLKK